LKVVVKRTNFFTFFALPNFKRGGAPKSCTCVNIPSQTRQAPKFRRATPPNFEVIMAHLFHFEPIFDPLLKKVVREAPVPGGGCASKTWSFSSACKNLGAQHPLGAEIRSSGNCALGGYDFTSKSPRSLNGTSPFWFRLTQKESR